MTGPTVGPPAVAVVDGTTVPTPAGENRLAPGAPQDGHDSRGDHDGTADQDATVPAEPAEPAGPHRPGLRDWSVVAGLCLLAAWVAVVAVFFLPLHLGSVPMPISALLPVALLAWAPRAAHRLTGRMAGAALVVLAWFVVSVYLVLVRNDLYLNYPVTVYLGQWRVMLLLGLGALTAAATLGLLWGDHLRSSVAARTAAAADAEHAPPADPVRPPDPA